MAYTQFSDEARIFFYSLFNEVSRPQRTIKGFEEEAFSIGSAIGTAVTGLIVREDNLLDEGLQALRKILDNPTSTGVRDLAVEMRKAQETFYSAAPANIKAQLGPYSKGII